MDGSSPDRIWILGSAAAGKSTLAERLSSRLDVPRQELDALFWGPGWSHLSDEEMRAEVDRASSGPRWVIDGNFTRQASDLWARADLVVWLDLPLATILRRLVVRSIRRAVSRETIHNGNRESFLRLFHPTDSILIYTARTFRARRRGNEERLTHLPHVRLRSQRSVDEYVEKLEGDR